MFRRHWKHHHHKKIPAVVDVQPLSDFSAGQTGVVIKIAGGTEFLSRMIALGISPGAEITVLQNHRHGPILTYVRESRLALGRGEAQKILLQVSYDPLKHPHQS